MKNLLSLTSVLLFVNVSCGKSSDSSDKNAPKALISEGSAASTDGVNPTTKTLGSGEVSNGNVEPAVAVDGVPVTSVGEPTAPAPVVAFEIDASVKDVFAYLDLDTGKVVAESDASWDLAFKKTVIKMNGAGVKAAIIKDSTFDAVLKADEGSFLNDAPVAGGKETDGLVFHSTDAWYAYNMDLHVISSHNYVYVIKTNAGAEFKFSIVDYYNVDRLPGILQLKWQQLSVAPAALTAAE